MGSVRFIEEGISPTTKIWMVKKLLPLKVLGSYHVISEHAHVIIVASGHKIMECGICVHWNSMLFNIII